MDNSSTTVVAEMGDAVPSREQVRHGLRDNVLIPAAEKVFCVVCNAAMFYLGANGHVYLALVAVVAMAVLGVDFVEPAATSRPSVSSTSKTELLRNLDPDKRSELLRDDLPRWVKFPDVEKCEWLNKVIAQIWPRAQVILARSMKEALETELELVKPSVGMTELGIRSLNFGTAAPSINGIKCLESTDNEQVTVDVDVLVVTQNSEVVMSLTNPLLHVAMSIEILDFVEKPTIDFQLKTLHINLMEVPALSPVLHKAINSAVERRCLWPNKVLIPFVDNQNVLDMESLVVNHSLGVLVFRGLQVSEMCPKRGFARWSGVYRFCLHFSIGKENVTARTIHGQRSSNFAKKTFQLLVIDPQIQDLNVTLECSEALQPQKLVDNELIHLNHLKPRIGCEEHVSFGCDGDRRAELEVYWHPFTRTRQGSSTQHDQASLPDDIAQMGVVFIKLLRCERLTSRDINGSSDPYLVFRVGCCSKQSSIKRHTLNPIWDPPESFELLVTDNQHDELPVAVMASDLLKTDDTIGQLQISLAPVQRALRFTDTCYSKAIPARSHSN